MRKTTPRLGRRGAAGFPATGRTGIPLAPGLLGLACAVVLATDAVPAAAQIRVGGQGVYQTGVLKGQFGAGGRAEIDLGFVAGGLAAIGIFDRFFPDCDDCSQWDASGLAGFVQGPFHLGLGATYQRLGSGDDAGAVGSWSGLLLAGFRFDRLEVFVPFLEVRQELASQDQNQQTVSLGFMVGPSRARTAPRAPQR